MATQKHLTIEVLKSALLEAGVKWDGNGNFEHITTNKQYEQDQRLALLEDESKRNKEFKSTIFKSFLGSLAFIIGVIWLSSSTITGLNGDLAQAKFDITEMKTDIANNREWQTEWAANGELKHDTEQNLHIQNLWDSVKSIWRLHDNEGHPYAPKPEWSNKDDDEG